MAYIYYGILSGIYSNVASRIYSGIPMVSTPSIHSGILSGIYTDTLSDIYPLVNYHSYWKWPFIVDFPIENGDFP